ncbi:MAG: DUF1549 domain-containing protein [Bacteroidota bacterium]
MLIGFRSSVLTKTVCVIMALCFFPALNASSKITDAQMLKSSNQIDALIEKNLLKHNKQRNEKISDQIFLRRIYLAIAGRIPTHKEAKDFLKSKDPKKRQSLIDYLLNSDGYVHHFYHFWADLLRLKTNPQNGRVVGTVAYIEWVKENLRENKPYHHFVKELITASGYPWDNPAVGYYLRDFGMPLDNMSNTMQVFLGTQMQCAQCHNHPFDKWTQKDYYELAAFTYDIHTIMPRNKLDSFKNFTEIVQRQRKKGDKSIDRSGPAKFQTLKAIFDPMTIGAHILDRDLKLPKDYKYKDAEPKQKVVARVPFSKEIVNPEIDDQRYAFADWMTSDQNPRFSKVIANRLWKKVMGVGLIEPVDDLKDETEASNTELMEYLSQLMRDVDYDMKQFLRTLYNTKTYQSAAYGEEVDLDKTFLYQGPTLRRMTAEQFWDSILTLVVEDIDQREGSIKRIKQLAKVEDNYRLRAEILGEKDAQELYALAKEIIGLEEQFLDNRKRLLNKIQETSSKKLETKLRSQMTQMAQKKNQAIEKIIYNSAIAEDSMMSSMIMSIDTKSIEENAGNKDDKWNGLSNDWVRASELPSPYYPGHFLRQFGQSDREVIDNAYDDASVTQALSLLNGPYGSIIVGGKSSLKKAMNHISSPGHKMEFLFLSVLSRYPEDKEVFKMMDFIRRNKKGQYVAMRTLVTAMINSQEFRFIQ